MGFITNEQIFLNQPFSNQEEVFTFLAKKTVELNIAADSQAVLTSLKAREAEGTTGMLEGFAIPHAKAAAIQKASMLVVRLTNPIDWNSLDGIPTEFVIALFIPDAEVGSTHLKLLSKIARLLMKDEFRDFLKAQDSEEKIVELLNERLSED